MFVHDASTAPKGRYEGSSIHRATSDPDDLVTSCGLVAHVDVAAVRPWRFCEYQGNRWRFGRSRPRGVHRAYKQLAGSVRGRYSYVAAVSELYGALRSFLWGGGNTPVERG